MSCNMDIAFRKNAGYTLIEVLIVVVIIALLATIAVPSYQAQMMSTRRADGKSMLMEVMQSQERYFTEHLEYTTELRVLGYQNDKDVESHEKFYLISAMKCDASPPIATIEINECVKLEAEPVGAQVDDGALTVNSYGAQSPPGKWSH